MYKIILCSFSFCCYPQHTLIKNQKIFSLQIFTPLQQPSCNSITNPQLPSPSVNHPHYYCHHCRTGVMHPTVFTTTNSSTFNIIFGLYKSHIILKFVQINFVLLFEYGLLLFPGGPKAEADEHQAGCRDVFAVWRRSKCWRHENHHPVLLCSILLEILEGYNLHFLWSYS